MATDIWWHGQKYGSARMGEAAWTARLHDDRCLRSVLDESLGSKGSRRRPWSSSPLECPQTRLCGSKRIPSVLDILHMVLLAICLLIRPSTAVFITFENCLSPNIINSNNPQQLQFVPQYVWATLNSTAVSHGINFTVYGNVTGVATLNTTLPPSGDLSWKDSNNSTGKIPDVAGPPGKEKYTTFTTQFNVLDYTPYNPPATRFCNSSALTQCPLAPVFNTTVNENNVTVLPAFSVAHDLYSSYAFTSINAVLALKSGDIGGAPLACVEASITPDLGNELSNTLTYIPLVVLILVAIATASAAIFSPWGSVDVFKFTSNYGRDDDLLRLVTPGFGDCLQYLQFIVLAGSLSLNYPGFFQPVVSQISWSVLMFNQSFVSHGNGSHSLIDGMYVVNGSYGLDRMSQLVGMTADKDIWAGMAVWLLVIVAAVVIIIQIGFAFRSAYRFISNTQQEDLREKNVPFSVGNAIRIVFNYFLLPVVALSAYQLVVAGRSLGATVGIAAVTLVFLIGFAGYVLWVITATRPRSYLFDDLPTVLLYGPLYNTYSDNAATFALVPVMLTFLRGIAIGAVQPSGIAQLVLLAICEVIMILTLNAFRPFHSPTSMNAFHTFFAVVRLLIVLLMTAFLPSLGIKDSPRGWIGYIILLMHAIVLVFGFFLNAVQTLVEVLARMAGAGGEDGAGGGAARGGLVKVFGMRQLSRRHPRPGGSAARQSVGSDATMLAHDADQKSLQWNGGRSRSMSGSSAILLNRQGATSDNRRSVGLESVSAGGAGDTPVSGGASAFSYLPGGSQAAGQGGQSSSGIVNLRNADAADPYYRPPRPRRTTLDASPTVRPRGSWSSAEWAKKRWSHHSPDLEGSPKPGGEGPSLSGRGTPTPAHLGAARDRSDSDGEDPRQSKTDYATREVDFYYGVRGPALSNLPTRRLKTGPADPTGPVMSASGWLKSLFGGKTKEKGKGFEVVRSSRAPAMGRPTVSGTMLPTDEAPYSDEPRVTQPERSRDLALSDEGDAIGAGTRHLPDEESPSPLDSDEEGDDDSISDDDWRPDRESQISSFPPILPTIETPGGIELPSRIASKASSRPTRHSTRSSMRPPNIPRKSSRRDSSTENDKVGARLSTVAASPRSTRAFDNDPRPQRGLQLPEDQTRRLPFDSHHKSSRSQDTHLSTGGLSTGGTSMNSSMFSPGTQEADEVATGHGRHPSSVLGSLAPDLRQDRPSSLGYVQQHRASDNIHTASPDDPQMLGSSAELVDDPRRRSVSPDIQPHAL